jgi:Fe-S-cluster containining protein
MSADDPRAFALDAVRDTLGKSTDVDSCVALTERIDALTTQAIEYFQGVACRKGCSFCCHLRVMVYAHEAIALFRYLNSRIPAEQAAIIRQRLAENAKRGAPKTACAFLVEGTCAAYPVRPGACSGYHSLSREDCERAHSDSSVTIPMLQGLHHIATSLDEGLDQALAAAGLSNHRVELHAALAALIRNPTLMERWRSGRALLKE